MEIQIERFTAEEWSVHAEVAHLAIFNEDRPSSMNRIDFALMCHVGALPYSYATFRELDSQSVYIQYGGAFKSIISTTRSYECYKKTLDTLKSYGYKWANTLVENTNIVMLKFALKYGLRIIGTRVFENKIYCELLIDFKE